MLKTKEQLIITKSEARVRKDNSFSIVHTHSFI